MNVLNLDDLAKESRTITHEGRAYKVVDMTVQNFIETQKKANELGDAPNDIDQVEAYVEMISGLVPELDEQAIREMSFKKMTAILSFLNGAYDEVKEPQEEKKGAKRGKA